MHRNENKYDQLFRDRLRDISHPVRSELWSRIHSRITGRKPSVPNPRTKPPLLSLATLAQKLRLLGSTGPSTGLFSNVLSTAAAVAVLVITLGIIHFAHTRTTMPPSAQPVSSVTPRDSSRYRSDEPATPTNPRTTLPGTAFTKPNPTPENTATATAIQPSHEAGASGIDRIPANPRTEASASKLARSNERALLARPLLDRPLTPGDPITPGDHTATATPGKQAPGIQTSGKFSVGHHNHNTVTLPALALTSNRAAIAAGAPGSKSLHNNSNNRGNWPALLPFKRTGSVSLYASPDFPNHYYAWSYTLGFRATFRFSRHWSFTSGFEYARVNVPTQTVPGNSGLQAFHFSNYEVPVLFGYTRTSRHAALTVYGGAILNLYFHASTSTYIDNWPDRDSYGAVLGVEYSYSLDRHLAIFAQPYARYSISDYRMFTQTQRWSFGTLLGIKYQL